MNKALINTSSKRFPEQTGGEYRCNNSVYMLSDSNLFFDIDVRAPAVDSMVLIFFFAELIVAGNDTNTFTRLHKDNTIRGGDGQRQAGKAKERKQRRVDELIIAKDFRLDSFFVSATTTDKAYASVEKERRRRRRKTIVDITSFTNTK